MTGDLSRSRRRLLHGLTGLAALGCLPPIAIGKSDEITRRLASYMLAARDRPLPAEAASACKLRILDTFAAMVSGSRMRPGQLASAYVRGLGGRPEASIVAGPLRSNAVNAALANAMCAHADETDDFEPQTKAHPGCSSLPAALAMAEKNGGSGVALMRGMALGYDLGCRLLVALGADLVRKTHRSAEGVSATFCALGAASALTSLDVMRLRFAISYAAQQVSGLWSWVNDEEHIEKAFDFAGMGARNGVMAVTMVESGLTGTADVLDGMHNLFIAQSTQPRPEAMLEGLGSQFYVTETAIKTYSVGYPCQSALDALLTLRREHAFTPDGVAAVRVRLPTDAVGIVGNSAMPDVNCPHLVALALAKGTVSFVDSHDVALMEDPKLLALRQKVLLVGDESLMDPEAPRGAIVEIELNDGSKLQHHTRFPSGTKQNPLSADAVAAKARDLMLPVLGAKRSQALIDAVYHLESVKDVRQLRAHWTL